jgi:hypothetical protein
MVIPFISVNSKPLVFTVYLRLPPYCQIKFIRRTYKKITAFIIIIEIIFVLLLIYRP